MLQAPTLINFAVTGMAMLGSVVAGYLLSKKICLSHRSGYFQTSTGIIECSKSPDSFRRKLILVSLLALFCFLLPAVFWLKLILNRMQ